MLQRTLPAAFIAPCLPTKTEKLPSGTVRVEHVTVNEGGQAIVGNVNHGGRGPLKNEEATP